jgi:predicted permease
VRPPRVARALLGLATPEDERDYLLDDLHEEFMARAARDGIARARRWYWFQVLSSLAPMLMHRARRVRVRPGTARLGILDAMVLDLRFAARTFARRPGFTLVALVTLAVAIGANTAIFSVVNGVLFKSIPGLSDTRGVVEIARDVDGEPGDVSYPLARAMGRESALLESVAALDWSPLSVGGADRPEVRLGLAVTSSYFDVLRVSASRGRLFSPDEATYPSVRPVAVISESLRAARFADQEIPGGTLIVNGVPLTVIGVAEGGFRGHALVPVDVFLPLGLPVPGLSTDAALSNMASSGVQALGRLREGSSARQASEELTSLVSAALQAETGARRDDYRIRVDAWGTVPVGARVGVTAFLSALLLLVGLVLAMACINVAGMVLSRSAERGDEIAVRMAMGAGRGRIVRQLLAEATLLALVAGALGLPLAVWAARLLLMFEPPLPPGFDFALDFGLDARVLAFSFAVAVGSAVLFNLAPAIHAARTDVMAAIKGDAAPVRPARTWGRSLLVSGQMALSLVLLATAGLFLRSLSAMRTMDPGWSTEDVYTTDLDLELTGTPEGDGKVFFSELLSCMAAAPGVEAVALAHKLPLGSTSSFGDVSVEGREPPEGRAGFEAFFGRVSPGYFSTLDLALLQGRDFEASDAEGSPRVAIVNRTMARRLWPGEDALGKTFRIPRGDSTLDLTVVGVAEDASYKSLFEQTPNFYYLPSGQWYNAHMLLFVRTAPGLAADVRERVTQVVAALQPSLPREPVVPLDESLALAFAPQRIGAWVSGVLGILGLLLGAVGVYGVTALAVSRRVREVGIRMALGATRGDVVSLVLRQGMVAPLVGMGAGLLGALAMAGLVSRFLAGVDSADPTTFGAAALMLLAVALIATLVPAGRAARQSPSESLRSE